MIEARGLAVIAGDVTEAIRQIAQVVRRIWRAFAKIWKSKTFQKMMRRLHRWSQKMQRAGALGPREYRTRPISTRRRAVYQKLLARIK